LSRRIPFFLSALGLALVLGGCGYDKDTSDDVPTGTVTKGVQPVLPSQTSISTTAGTSQAGPGSTGTRNKAILENVVTLIERAIIRPGGQNFEIATRNLNQYFDNPNPADYAMSEEVRTFVARGLPEVVTRIRRKPAEEVVKEFERPQFQMPDARHLEDCMLYAKIARRVAGSGDDLTRVRRLFEWTLNQVTLVPPASLAGRSKFQAQSRPFDVLLRGLATEDGAGWAERAWVFLSLCRQIDLDSGLLCYTPRPPAQEGKTEAKDEGKEARPPVPVPWICVVLIEGKPYLFDARIGLAIPGPDGHGVATLNDALDDPHVLGRLELPGQSAYGTTRAALLDSPSKIGVMLDSSPGYFSPRMKLLQEELSGTDRTVLYRDPAAQARKFAQAIGPRFGEAKLWDMPIAVFTLLFTSGEFVDAAQQALALFDPDLPLVYARIKQLRGELPEAISEFVSMRFAERALLMDKKRLMPPEVQRAMDAYSTYFLGLCHLEQKNTEQAEFFFRETLKLLPDPGPGRLYYNMFRWGAETNLAKLLEARGETALATAYFAQEMPTPQHHGNLLRARDLIWRNPAAPLAPRLPPAPPPDIAAR
jgi:hypothetical protein